MFNQNALIKYHEQFPPQHGLAEEIILGGILTNQEIIKTSIERLVVDSFSLEIHQLIYRTIIDIYTKDKYIDPIILINNLWELNLLNKIGGIQKILDLLRYGQIFSSNLYKNILVEHYIKLLQDRYLRRILIQYGYDIIRLAYIPNLGYSTIFFKIDKYIDKMKELIVTDDYKNISNSLTNILFKIKNHHSSQKPTTISSGFYNLDSLINGFQQSDLIVIAGRPSMGKTSFSLNIALNLLKQNNKGICIFSLEMSREQILYKLLSILSNIPSNKLKLGNINNKDWINLQKAANKLIQGMFYIDDTSNVSLSYLILKTKILKYECPDISIIIIDYLQLIQIDKSLKSNRSEELSIITRSLKILAKELNLPIIILSQLNRNVENRLNKKPLLSDLRESGCIHFNTKIIYNYQNTQDKIKYTSFINPQKLLKIKLKKYTYNINNINNTIINTTHNHQILINNQWLAINKLKYSNTLILYSTIYCTYFSLLNKIESLHKKMNVYDIKINTTKTFYCNQNIITHNSIEQDADLVLMLYREAYYNRNTVNLNLTEIIIAKHRNGPTGVAELKFNPNLSTFTN
uniref:Replicative DNA helicase n=1 Tax=Dichotomaria marginata TaxID=268567 RepID=A0A1G4NSN8_9FLOR|nr:Replication helicase subunit [Dichotomaria marginata]SCW21634.1 Replication helicase subunit [Dichotomaria marginata]